MWRREEKRSGSCTAGCNGLFLVKDGGETKTGDRVRVGYATVCSRQLRAANAPGSGRDLTRGPIVLRACGAALDKRSDALDHVISPSPSMASLLRLLPTEPCMPRFVTPQRKQSRGGAGPIVLYGPLPGKMGTR